MSSLAFLQIFKELRPLELLQTDMQAASANTSLATWYVQMDAHNYIPDHADGRKLYDRFYSDLTLREGIEAHKGEGEGEVFLDLLCRNALPGAIRGDLTKQELLYNAQYTIWDTQPDWIKECAGAGLRKCFDICVRESDTLNRRVSRKAFHHFSPDLDSIANELRVTALLNRRVAADYFDAARERELREEPKAGDVDFSKFGFDTVSAADNPLLQYEPRIKLNPIHRDRPLPELFDSAEGVVETIFVANIIQQFLTLNGLKISDHAKGYLLRQTHDTEDIWRGFRSPQFDNLSALVNHFDDSNAEWREDPFLSKQIFDAAERIALSPKITASHLIGAIEHRLGLRDAEPENEPDVAATVGLKDAAGIVTRGVRNQKELFKELLERQHGTRADEGLVKELLHLWRLAERDLTAEISYRIKDSSIDDLKEWVGTQTEHHKGIRFAEIDTIEEKGESVSEFGAVTVVESGFNITVAPECLKWMKSINSEIANAVHRRLERLEAGNLGDFKTTKSSSNRMLEFRGFTPSGDYRLFALRKERSLTILLGYIKDGKKTEQNDAIEAADDIADRYLE